MKKFKNRKELIDFINKNIDESLEETMAIAEKESEETGKEVDFLEVMKKTVFVAAEKYGFTQKEKEKYFDNFIFLLYYTLNEFDDEDL